MLQEIASFKDQAQYFLFGIMAPLWVYGVDWDVLFLIGLWRASCRAMLPVGITFQEQADMRSDTGRRYHHSRSAPLNSRQKKYLKYFFSFIFIIIVFAGLFRLYGTKTISGQVFIVTKGSGNVEMGSLEIRFIEEKLLSEYGQKNFIVEFGYGKKNFSDVFGMGEILARTDSNGRFTAKIPVSKKGWIIAFGQRQTFDKVESYYWLVPITSDSIMLTNDNLLEGRLNE